MDSKNSADLHLQVDASIDHTLTYGDIVIKHVDFYGCVHTHCVDICRWMLRAAQIKLNLCKMRTAYGNDNNAIVLF